MPESTAVKVRRDGTIAIADNAGFGGANVYTVAYEDGDFAGNIVKADRIVIRDRGTIVGLRQGDDPVGELSFSVHLRQLLGSTDLTILDVVYRTGAAAAWVSVGGTSAYEQFLVQVRMTIEGMDRGDSVDHTATFANVLLVAAIAEGDPDKITVTGEVYGAVTRTGPA